MKHGVNGKPDPDFEPDPDYVYVWDPKKRVYRRVHKDDAPEQSREVESFNVNVTIN